MCDCKDASSPTRLLHSRSIGSPVLTLRNSRYSFQLDA